MPQIEIFALPPSEGIPNSPLPLIIYRQALMPKPDRDESVAHVKALLGRNGWEIAWYTEKGLHPFHHYHSNAHEIVWVARGRQRGVFGGPGGVETVVAAGDLIVLPAGVGHFGLEKSDDLYMIGGFPSGEPYGNIMRGAADEQAKVADELLQVPVLTRDPLTGGEGPLTEAWRL